MCVVSMVMDHYRDRWEPWTQPPSPVSPPLSPRDFAQLLQPKPTITPEEIAEFRKLLERAREYDKRNSEPECELEEKKVALKAIAAKLGVEIAFL
jgi:hypothetical protein